MGASKKRRVKGTGGEEPWGDEHLQNLPDQSGWNDKKKAAFDRLRKKWSAENGDQEDSTSTDAGGFGGTIEQKTTMLLRVYANSPRWRPDNPNWS